MNRIAGLPNSDSNRAFDMFLKTRYLLEQAGGRVVFATGTPISNTMAEMYTMLRYLAPGLLKERGVEHFDAWAGNFAEAVTALGTRAGRLRLPHAHALCQIHQSARAADHVPHGRRRADRRHAEAAPPDDCHGGKPQIVGSARQRTAQRLYQDADRARRAPAYAAHRSFPGQHAQDHRRRPEGRPRHAPGGTLRRPVRRYEAEPRRRTRPQRLAGDRERPLDPACILRPVDAGPRAIQRLR